MTHPTQTVLPLDKGLPLVGKTLSFLKDPFGFVQTGLDKHGPIFMTSFMGEDLVIFVGLEAAELWLDEEKLERHQALPSHFKNIFGSDVVLPLLDGNKHKFHKNCVLAAFTPEALVSYLPDIQETVENGFEQWVQQKNVHGVSALQEMAMEAILRNMLGMKADDPELKKLTGLYMSTTGAMTALPLPLPGTLYTRSKNTFKGIVDYLKAFGHKRKNALGQDAFSRIIQAEIDGQQLPVENVACEIHHCVLGGYIVWAEFAMMLQVLKEKPELVQQLQAEIQAIAPEGPVTARQLGSMPQMLNFVLEIKRLCPNVPGQFAKARKTFEFQGHTIPKGTRLFLAMYAANQSPEIYANPHTFDHTRFGEDRAEDKKHEYGYIPQGVGPEQSHRCPGLDYASLMMQMFGVVLLRDYRWDIPPQNLNLNWSLLPPEPIDGLKLQFFKK